MRAIEIKTKTLSLQYVKHEPSQTGKMSKQEGILRKAKKNRKAQGRLIVSFQTDLKELRKH